jgi:predicted secreted protein
MSNESRPAEPAVVLDLGDGRDEVASVSVGDRVEINVTSPGTTGYLWHLDTDETTSRLVSHDIVPDPTTFGGSGTARFLVEFVRPGNAELRLRLKAPWEAFSAREYRVRVEIAEGESVGDDDG